MDKILAGKRESRQQLAALPFARKLELVEKMHNYALMRDVVMPIPATWFMKTPCAARKAGGKMKCAATTRCLNLQLSTAQ